MRATKASHFPPSLVDIQFKALSISTPRLPSRAGDVAERIRCEFVEMRGFSPTVEQAARLFQVNRDECMRVLKRLVDEGFLRQTPDGRYRLPPQQ
jgi:hypothetical protein